MDIITTIILASLVLLFANAVQGLSGFGRGLVAAPLLTLFMPANMVIPVLIFLALISGIYMLKKTAKYSNIKEIWIMIVFSVIGTTIGVNTLSSINVSSLKLILGIVVVGFAIIMSTGLKLKIKENLLSYSIVGSISGFLGGLASVGGPPIVLFLQNQEHDKNRFRGNLSVFFFCGNLTAIANLFIFKLVTSEVITYSLWLIPASIVGAIVGNLISKKVEEKNFKIIVYVILILSGLSAVISAII